MAKLVKIESLLDGSHRHFLSDSQLQPNPILAAEGWERRFTVDKQRAKEILDLYRQLGYEVCAEPMRGEEVQDDCQDCRTVVSYHLLTVYTRKRKS